MCHKPYNPHCSVCRAVKSRHSPHRRKKVPKRESLSVFGELVTCDHIIAQGINESLDGHPCALVIYDVRTQFLAAQPTVNKSGPETCRIIKQFCMGDIIDRMYSDGSGEIEWACHYLSIPHDTCQTGDKQGNGIAEQMVQEVKKWTTCNLEQSGLPHCY